MDINQFIPSGAAFIVWIVTLAGVWFKFQNKIENLERKDAEHDKRIDDIVLWSHAHEKEASEMRERFNKELSKLEGANLVVNEQFKQIMERLEDIKDRMGKLESK